MGADSGLAVKGLRDGTIGGKERISGLSLGTFQQEPLDTESLFII